MLRVDVTVDIELDPTAIDEAINVEFEAFVKVE